MDAFNRLLLLAILCLLGLGCSFEHEAAEEVGSVESALHHKHAHASRDLKRSFVQLVRTFALEKAVNAHDVSRIARAHAASGRLDIVGFPVREGRAAIATQVETLFQAFPAAEFGFVRLWLRDDTVIGEWVLRGVQTGAFGALPATGLEAGVRGASVLSFDARGEIRHHVMYFDAVTVLSQLGFQASPARPVPALPGRPEVHLRRADPSEAVLATWSRAFYDAFESGDTGNIEPLLASDMTFDNCVEAAPRFGASAFVESFVEYTTAFPDNVITEASQWFVGNTAIVENVVDATHLGALGPIPPTGRPVHLRFLDILEVQHGAVMSDGHTYTNYLDLFQQIGLSSL